MTTVQDEAKVSTNPMDGPGKKSDGDVDAVHEHEFVDPAIMVVGKVSLEFRYSKEELLDLQKTPSSLKRPDFLDSAYFNNNGIWDPEPWHYGSKALDPSETGGVTVAGDGHSKRRSGDPRERIRKEQDGIVLSPQRRSFNSGCFVPLREPLRPNRPHSPLSKADAPHISHRDLNTGPAARRIGSGRILPWDFQEKSDVDNDFGYRRDRRDAERDRDERFDRRSFTRDFDITKEKDRHMSRNNNNNNNNGRYSNRRISNESREEEPEWFSSGPMSQTDTIELRGFDENERVGSKKKSSAQKKKQKEQQQLQMQQNQQNSGQQHKIGSIKENNEDGEEVVVGKKEKGVRPTSTSQDGGRADKSPIPAPEPHVESAVPEDASFNFEDILKCDSIPGISGLLSNGVESGDVIGSRFSRWFQREKSPPNKQSEGGRSTSLQDPDHHHIIKNLLGETFGEPTVAIPQPGDSESYFAPISPAASSVIPQPASGKSLNLMEMLQRSNKHRVSQMHGAEAQPSQQPPPPAKGLSDGPGPGKILCLEELEATIMQGIDMTNKHAPKGEDDLNAFKRLFSQGNTGINHHINNGPVPQKPMSIMEMLSHSQQQDEAARLASQRIGGSTLPQHLTDMSYKLQQVQNQVQQQQKQQVQFEMITKLMNASLAQQTRASPLQDVGINHRELLNRPEAQAILQGLKRGDITPQHLYQQLANPAMQPRHRDLLLTILKMQVAGGMPQSASPVPPPHHLYQQQLRVSPLPPNAVHQRIPSPRELQVHTQNIMQRALIKKKLEEQEENFRKKQAQARGTSPAKMASPTPLAFTPTAVLRKMTADKDDGSKDKGDSKIPQGRAVTGMRTPHPPQPPQQVNAQQPQTWSNQFTQRLKQPVGRPIVKANNNYQQANQAQQDAQYFQQQRLQLQARKNQQTFGSSANSTTTNFPNQSQQFPQLSQQQLRAQHQNVRAQHQQQQSYGQHQQQPQSWAQQMLQGQAFDNRQVVGRGGLDGDLSPTSNQLARWFSPDLLDRARKGKLPGIPPNAVAQHALNLEEVERQSTPVGHN